MEKETTSFGNLFYENPLPSWVYDRSTYKIVDVNKAALAYYGYTKEEFLSNNATQLIIKDEVPSYLKSHESISKNENYFSLGIFNLQTNVSKKNRVAINGYKITNQDQECLLVVCNKKLSEKNKEQDASQMMDASLDIFCTINEEGNFVYASAACKKHWGYSPDELIGKSYAELIFPEDLPKTIKKGEKVFSGRKVKSFVNRYRKKEGGIAYNIWSVRWDENSKLLYCVARDGKKKVKREQKILESELRFKALIQEGSDLISIFDKDGNYTYTSPTITPILGIKTEDLEGRNAFEFIHTEDLEKVKASLQKIKEESKVIVEPFRFKNNNGEWRWIETVLTNMLDNPAVNGIVSNSRDITDVLLSRQKIETTELFNSIILESSPDCLKIIDLEGRLQFMNLNGLCQMEIDDFSNLKNKMWFTLWGFENEQLIKDAVQKALKGETAQFTAYCPTAKGNPRWWDVLVSPIGQPAQQIIAVSRDITSKKAEEQQLKLLESVITNTNEAVLITEADYDPEIGPKIIYVNPAFTEMTGYTAGEIIGKTPRVLQGPKTDEAALIKLRKALQTWETCEITMVNYKKNGAEFWVNFTVTPVADEKGWYTHWIAIERDVTEQKNKELENELIGQISIDFNSENNYIGAAKALCQSVSAFGKFDWVELWTLNLEKNKIQLVSHFTASPDNELGHNYSYTNETDSVLEDSLVRKVWSERTELLWNETDNQNDFAGIGAVVKRGTKCILGIPLFFDNEVIGVLQIGTKFSDGYLNSYISIFKKLGTFIGSELNRKKLEEDLSNLFNAIPHILCVTDFEGRFLQINKSGCELLGYSEEELLLHNFDEFVHPDDRAISQYEAKRVEKGNNSFRFENRYLSKTGEVIWLSWYCNPEMEEGVIFATAVNISEEKKLRELNRQANSLAKIGSWELDLTSDKLFWSQEIHNLHKTDSKVFVPDVGTALHFYRQDFRELVGKAIENCINFGENFDFEAVIVTTDQQERWVRVLGDGDFSEGVCTRIFGSTQNITERKEAEIRLQSLSDNLPGVMFQYLIYPDQKESLNHVSGSVQELWGFSIDEVMQNTGLIWDQIAAAGSYQDVRDSIQESIQTRSQWTCRMKYLLPSSGELHTHLGYGTPTFLTDGTILYNCILLNITEEVKKEELLKQATQMAHIGSWELDLVQQQIFWSDKVHELHETDPKTFLPSLQTGIQFYRDDFQDCVRNNIEKCITEGKPFDFEAVLVTANKKERWVRVLGHGELVAGSCKRIFGSFQDINQLKETEIRLRSLSENLPGVIYQYTLYPDGTDAINHILGNVEELWGLTAAEAAENIGLLWDQIKFGGELEKVQTSLFKAIETRSRWTCRFKTLMPNGELKTHLGNGTPLFLADGSIVLNVIVLDITQQAKNEELLTQASETARIGSWEMNLVNHEEDGMYWSPIIKEILELEENYDPYFSKGLELHLGDSKVRAKTAMDALMQKGIEFDLELLFKTGKGNQRWIRCIGKSKTINTNLTKIYGSFQDIHERKKSMIALVESETKFRTILEAEPDCIKLVSPNGNLLMMNAAGFDMIEADHEEEVLGKSLLELVVLPEHRNAFAGLAKRVFSGESGALVFEIQGLKGTRRWLETHAVPMKNGQGKITTLLGITRDITERKKTEESLKHSEETNRLIMNSALDAIVCIDIKGNVIFWNPQAHEIFGWTEEEMMGNSLSNYIIPENFRVMQKQGMDHYILTAEGNTLNKLLELTAVNKKGEYFPVELTVIPIKQGNEEFYCTFIRDITQRKNAAQKILLANERFEKVTEATNDVIWDWDIINNTLYRSKAVESFFGKNAIQYLSGIDFSHDSFHPNDIPEIKSSLEKAITDPLCMRWELEYRIYTSDNALVYVMDQGVIIRNDEGKAIRMVGAMTDITNQKAMTIQLSELNQELQKYTQELEHSNEELEQFAFVASHDLQEPLRMITSFMDLLQRKYGDSIDEKGHQYIHFATDGAKRMKQIILDLLEYSRTNKPTEGKEEVDLNEILLDFKQLRRKLITEKKAVINADKLPVLKTYKAAVAQVLHCIIDNALKYTSENKTPKIVINVVENKKEWLFSITDNGIGIDPQFYDKIFVIFQRLHNKDKYSGTGIGLSIAKRHVEFLGGQLWLEAAEGTGTVFYFTIPKN